MPFAENRAWCSRWTRARSRSPSPVVSSWATAAGSGTMMTVDETHDGGDELQVKVTFK